VRVELLRAPRDTCWMLMGQRFRDIDEVRQLARGFMTEIPMTAARPSP